ncbi:MAG: NADH-quinone oxidoreductase subunit NuoH [Deltaproteobacteria bacterium]|nr:MAG: NADH-quinone oxidoreductase subunit NuoH [Deltaproteobacteria bacterium]
MSLTLINVIAALAAVIGFVALNAAYLVWAERKGAGYFQRRPGPLENGPWGLLQPPVDGIKLLAKQLVIPGGVDKILFITAPVLAMFPAVVSFVTIPFGERIIAHNVEVGVLLIFAFASTGSLSLIFAGWASRNKYATISAIRGVSQAVAYEIPMLITTITIVLITGSMDLMEIVRHQAGGFWHWHIWPLKGGLYNLAMPFSFLIFFVCSVAESNRAPFDLGEAESELVAGFHTEYSSMGFGLFFMAEYANIVVGACLTTIFFLGGWHSPFGLLPDGIWWFLLKIYLLIFVFIWIRWTFPRTTIYGLLNLSWKILIPLSLVNLLLTAVLLKVFQA